MSGGEKKQVSGTEWAIVLTFFAIVFALVAIWTAPASISTKAAITGAFLLAVAGVILRVSR